MLGAFLLASALAPSTATAAPYSSHSQLYTCCTDSATKRAMFAEAAASGAAYIRVDIGMETVAPQLSRSSERHWGGIDEAARLSAESALPILAVLHGTPPELTVCDEPWERRRLCPPRSPREWATVAGEIAERYAGSIDHLQIWNEPDAQWAFAGSPQDYSRLLVASARRDQESGADRPDRAGGPDELSRRRSRVPRPGLPRRRRGGAGLRRGSAASARPRGRVDATDPGDGASSCAAGGARCRCG